MKTLDVVDRFLGSFSAGEGKQMWRLSYTTTAKVIKDEKEVNDATYDMVVVGTVEQVIRWLRAKGGEIKYVSLMRMDEFTDVSGTSK